MRSSAELSPARTESRDRLIKRTADEGPCPAVQRDPIETQKAVAEAITQLIRDGAPESGQLDALVALEREAQPAIERLLIQYVEGDAQVAAFEWKVWHCALRLTQSLFQANDHFLWHRRDAADGEWRKHEPVLLAQLFHHRKIEFLLRFLRYKKRSSELWRQLHEMYRCARERGLPDRCDAGGASDGKGRTTGEFEQQYLQILLLEAMNSGRFSPREGLWAYRWFARWCSAPGLQLAQLEDCARIAPTGFVVDPSGSDGLRRALSNERMPQGNLLHLDSSPLRAMIDQASASLRDGATTALPHQLTAAVRAGQIALLNKLSILFAPTPVDVERRAERKPVALAVQAIVGFPYIVEELCKNAQKPSEAMLSAADAGSENTLSPSGRPTFSPILSADASPMSLSLTGASDPIPQIWQVKDRSDSGCRMRGQIDNLNRVIPGALIAVRDSETAPWIVSVVRWFRRLMVDYVEIGVEYLGREPRFVKLVTDGERNLAVVDGPSLASRCFAALYLPPSEEFPTLPIKTLLLPAREFRPDAEVTLLSSNATYRLRLAEPIQQQYEYVWTSFAVIAKMAPPPAGID